MPIAHKLSQLTNNELKDILVLNGDETKYPNKPALVEAILALESPSYPPEVEAKLAAMPDEPLIDGSQIMRTQSEPVAGEDGAPVPPTATENPDEPYIAGDNGALKAALDALGDTAEEWQIRAAVEDYSLALVAVNVIPQDPTYSSAQGEIISVSNDFVQTHKYVVFKKPMLVPRIVADQLARMTHISHVTIDAKGEVETEYGYGVNRIEMAESFTVNKTQMPTRRSLQAMRNRQIAFGQGI